MSPAPQQDESTNPAVAGVAQDLKDGNTPEQTWPADPDEPELGEVTVSKHDNTTVYRWTVTGGTAGELTVTGQRRALRATADYIGGLSKVDQGQLSRVAGGPHYRVTPVLWELPALPGHGEQVAAMMTAVVEKPGSTEGGR